MAGISSAKLLKLLNKKGAKTDFVGTTGGIRFRRYLKDKEFEKYGEEATELGNHILLLQKIGFGATILGFTLSLFLHIIQI